MMMTENAARVLIARGAAAADFSDIFRCHYAYARCHDKAPLLLPALHSASHGAIVVAC